MALCRVTLSGRKWSADVGGRPQNYQTLTACARSTGPAHRQASRCQGRAAPCADLSAHTGQRPARIFQHTRARQTRQARREQANGAALARAAGLRHTQSAGACKSIGMRRDRDGASTIQRRNVLVVDELAKVEELRVGNRLLDEGDSRPPPRPIRQDEVLPAHGGVSRQA